MEHFISFFLLFLLFQRIPIPDFVPFGVGKLETTNAKVLAETYNYKLGVCTTGMVVYLHTFIHSLRCACRYVTEILTVGHFYF